MINYWSFNNNLLDSVGSAHLFNGANATLTFDRFNKSNSALDLKYGYYEIPNGVYFNGPYSITAWLYAREALSISKLIDIGFTNGSANVGITLFDNFAPKPYVRIKNGASNSTWAIRSSVNFTLNVWTHLGVTFDGAYLKIFMNGELVGQGISGIPLNVNRTNNFIGRSWSAGNPNINAIFDELRFYNRDLSQNEIKELESF